MQLLASSSEHKQERSRDQGVCNSVNSAHTKL